MWRGLALQFDAHRIEALALLRGVAEGQATGDDAQAFLAKPPTFYKSDNAGWLPMSVAPNTDGSVILARTDRQALVASYHAESNKWWAFSRDADGVSDFSIVPTGWFPVPHGLQADPFPHDGEVR